MSKELGPLRKFVVGFTAALALGGCASPVDGARSSEIPGAASSSEVLPSNKTIDCSEERGPVGAPIPVTLTVGQELVIIGRGPREMGAAVTADAGSSLTYSTPEGANGVTNPDMKPNTASVVVSDDAGEIHLESTTGDVKATVICATTLRMQGHRFSPIQGEVIQFVNGQGRQGNTTDPETVKSTGKRSTDSDENGNYYPGDGVSDEEVSRDGAHPPR